MSDSSPLITILFPLVDDRGWMLPSLRSYVRGQTLAAERYEVIVVGPRPSPLVFEELKRELRPGDQYLECDTKNEYRLFNYGSRHASSEILFLTESHVVAHADCLEVVAKHFENPSTSAARVTSLGQFDSKLSELQKIVFEESFARGSEDVWNRVLIHGFAIRGTVYASVGGFPEAAENFAPLVLGRRLARAGVGIDMLEQARVDHYYMTSLASLRRFITRFVRGEMDSRSQVWTEPERSDIPPNPHWERRALYTSTYWDSLAACCGWNLHDFIRRIFHRKIEPVLERTRMALRCLALRLRPGRATFEAYWSAVIDWARLDLLISRTPDNPVAEPGATTASQQLSFPLPTPSYPVPPEHGGPLLHLAPFSHLEVALSPGRWEFLFETGANRPASDLVESRIFLDGSEVHHRVEGHKIRFNWTEDQHRILTLSILTRPLKYPKCPPFGLALKGWQIHAVNPETESAEPQRRISVLLPLTEPRGKGRRCLESLFLEQSIPPDTFEIILLENGTQPKLVDYARSLLRPQDRILSFETDNEFLMWNRAVDESKTPLLFLTEAHCHIAPDCLEQSLQFLEQNPQAHGLRCTVKDEFVNTLSVLEEMFFERGRRDHPDGHWHQVSLRGMVLRRSSLEALGGLDPDFDHFGDKVLSARLRAQGWSLPIASEALIHHRNTSDFSEMEPHLRGFIEGEFEARFRYGDTLANFWFDTNHVWEKRFLCSTVVQRALHSAGRTGEKQNPTREAAAEKNRNRIRRALLRFLVCLRRAEPAFPLYTKHWRGVATQVAWETLARRPELCEPTGPVVLRGLHGAEESGGRRFRWTGTELWIYLPPSAIDRSLEIQTLSGEPAPAWNQIHCHLDGVPLRLSKLPDNKKQSIELPASIESAMLSLQIPRYSAPGDDRKLGIPLEELRIVEPSADRHCDLLMLEPPDPDQILKQAPCPVPSLSSPDSSATLIRASQPK